MRRCTKLRLDRSCTSVAPQYPHRVGLDAPAPRGAVIAVQTFNTKRFAVAFALDYFQALQWIGNAAVVQDRLGRANRVRSREAIDR